MRADMSRVIVPAGAAPTGPAASCPLTICHTTRACAAVITSAPTGRSSTRTAPLRRYLERQVGRPWDKIYSEIAAHLRADNTVQQHVRDHLRNFVAVKPRRYVGWYTKPLSGLWHQPLYVDDKDGILKRTDRLPEEKARRRARRARRRGRLIASRLPPIASCAGSTGSGTNYASFRCPSRSIAPSSNAAKFR
jgi:hypothetical protein